MATRDELIQQAQAKFQRDQLIEAAKKKWEAENIPVAAPPLSEQIETGARSALEGMSFGVSEPLISGVNAAVGNLIDSGFEAESLKDFLSKSIDTERIKREFASDVARRKQLEKEMPITAAGGEIAGALLAPFGTIGKGVSTVGKGAVEAATRLAGPLLEATKVAEVLPQTAKVAKAVSEAAATGAAAEGLKQLAEVPTGFMEEKEKLSLPEVAKTSAAVAAGVEAIPIIGRAIKAGGAKALSAFGGVKEQTIKEYLKRSEPLLPVTTEALKDQVDNALNRVQSVLVEQRKQGADDLLTAVKALKDKVIQGSKESYDILEKAGLAEKGAEKVISAKDILKNIDQQIRAQSSPAAGVLLTPLRETVTNKLTDLYGRVQSLAEEVGPKFSLPTAKQIIQALDEITEFSIAEGQFSSRLDQSLKNIRSNLNQKLRTLSPEYAQKMDEVSKDARLLETASDIFGTEQKALSNLQTLAVGKNPRINELANALEGSTGVKISRGVEAIKKTIPVEKLDPKTTQAFLKGVMSGRSIESKRTLKQLSELADEDLVRLADDAAMSAEFEKLTMNGSRDVNFWKEVLGGLTFGGAFAGSTGAVMGAGVGYLVKTFGAPATKKILDGVISVRGIPTVEKLSDALADVTPEVRKNLVEGFARATVTGMQKDEPKVVKLDPTASQTAILDLKRSNLDSITKAKAIQGLQSNNQIPTDILKRYMVGEVPKTPITLPKRKEDVLKEDRPEILKALDNVKGK